MAGVDLMAIGASTGGTEAIRQLLQQLPGVVPEQQLPGIVVTQHIAPSFVPTLAESLDKAGPLTVTVAADGQRIAPGTVYLAPGDRHLLVAATAGGYCCTLGDGPALDGHKPSVDAMFHSLADTVGATGIGVLLTGMGKDGARGLLAMRESGAYTIAQDERSSVVWGMPGEAVDIKAVDAIVGIDNMAQQIAAVLAQRL